MTEYKEIGLSKSYKSLYLGLLYNILVGLMLAVVVFFAVIASSSYFVYWHYMAEDKEEARRAEYLSSLQRYVSENDIDLENSDRIAEWVRENSYVYLLVYQSDEYLYPDDATSPVPGNDDKLSEHVGSRVDETLDRDELLGAAKSGGYHLIELSDGYVIVALSEYSKNLYTIISLFVSIGAAVLTLVFTLVRYIGKLIGRIKRFASDVTIVSELDMNYEIVSEGEDELSSLSCNVEDMRQTMIRHIENEKEARTANTELITSISHDIRTPLTVLMGYVEMMREHECDDVMRGYIDATETTALRLKQLSDDMFKYLITFGDTDKTVKLEEYDANTLFDQMLSEHILLLREMGYIIEFGNLGDSIAEGSLVRTDAQNLMRIVDNIFSNIQKYADIASPIKINTMYFDGRMTVEVKNKIRSSFEGAESNKIGLKTCTRLGSIVADGFEYVNDGEYFVCRLYMKIITP